MKKTKFERIVEFRPAFDKRSDEPGKDYGIGSVQILFVLKKGRKAVQFLMGTDWYLPSTIKEYKEEGIYKNTFSNLEKEPFKTKIDLRKDEEFVKNWDLGYHSPKPMYNGQTSLTDDCPYTGGKCYYDGSSLRPRELKVAENLIEKGSDFIWELLENDWNVRFGE